MPPIAIGDPASSDFDRAIRLKPDNADAFEGCCLTHGAHGAYDRAIADCDQTLRLNPGLAHRRSRHVRRTQFRVAFGEGQT